MTSLTCPYKPQIQSTFPLGTIIIEMQVFLLVLSSRGGNNVLFIRYVTMGRIFSPLEDQIHIFKPL